jgi:hypothetical protein
MAPTKPAETSWQAITAFFSIAVAVVHSAIWLNALVQCKRNTSLAPAYDLITPISVSVGSLVLSFFTLFLRQFGNTRAFDWLIVSALAHAAIVESVVTFSDWQNIHTRKAYYDAGNQKFLDSGNFQWVAVVTTTCAFGSVLFLSVPFLK